MSTTDCQPAISVIIPVYARNSHEVDKLDCCLQALDRNTLRDQAEIIVVDDCSPETAASAIEQVAHKYNARCSRQKENKGPGITRNYGTGLAKGKILAFIDCDCLAPRDWLLKITRPIREQNYTATTSSYSDPVRPSWITVFQNEDCLYRMPSIECQVSFVNSCNILLNSRGFNI